MWSYYPWIKIKFPIIASKQALRVSNIYHLLLQGAHYCPKYPYNELNWPLAHNGKDTDMGWEGIREKHPHYCSPHIIAHPLLSPIPYYRSPLLSLTPYYRPTRARHGETSLASLALISVTMGTTLTKPRVNRRPALGGWIWLDADAIRFRSND